MIRICHRIATEQDIPLIQEIYHENMEALHGVKRTARQWKELLTRPDTLYYIVYTTEPAGWFRLDREADGLWLGMLRVKPAWQRRGVGKAVLAEAERLAREAGYCSLGIHTTRDNLPAQNLYAACGYTLMEIGPCTTADGVERIGYTFCKNL